jgi:hypothetical protein
MLKHFGSGPDNETLLGDLAEQYQRNGSAMWYWRQTLKAIPVSFFKEIRAHKWIAARALLTGWVVWIICERMIPPLLMGVYYFRVAAYHVPYLRIIVIAILIGALPGWVIGRSHPSQRTGAVLFFAVSVIFIDLWLFAFLIYLRYSIFPRSVPFSRYAIPLAIDASASLLGILLGGGLLFDKSSTVTN